MKISNYMKIVSLRSKPAARTVWMSAALGCALATLPLAVSTARAQGDREKATKDVPQAADKAASERAPLSEAGTSGPANLTSEEAAFIKTAAQGNIAEVRMAKLALDNSSSEDVKEFANMMIKDHTAANEELGLLAKSHNINFPTEPSSEDTALMNKMQDVKGEAFDKAYASHAVEDHTKDLSEYKSAQKEIKDPKLLAYNEKTEQVVAHHLEEAKRLNAKVQKEG